MNLHRALQVSDLHDRAGVERVCGYIRSAKASKIGNTNAALYFSARAKKWESIRIRCARAAIAKVSK